MRLKAKAHPPVAPFAPALALETLGRQLHPEAALGQRDLVPLVTPLYVSLVQTLGNYLLVLSHQAAVGNEDDDIGGRRHLAVT